MIKYLECSSDKQLQQIYKLQKVNLARALSPEQMKRDGFVTCDHSIDLLTRMNSPWRHIIALDESRPSLGDQVMPRLAGYALVMLPAFENEFPNLQPMFAEFRRLKINDKPLMDSSFFVMGQVCVAKDYRGLGVAQGLYKQMRSKMKDDFDFVVTEISLSNPRSLRVHEKTGFKTICEYQTESGERWAVVLWDWS